MPTQIFTGTKYSVGFCREAGEVPVFFDGRCVPRPRTFVPADCVNYNNIYGHRCFQQLSRPAKIQAFPSQSVRAALAALRGPRFEPLDGQLLKCKF